MAAQPFCPHCGYDLEKAEPVQDGRFSYSPSAGFCVDGARLIAAPGVHEMLGTIMRAAGRPVSRDVLADRMGYEGDSPLNIVSVRMWQARVALKALSLDLPVRTIWGVGLCWVPLGGPEHRARVAA